MFRHAPALAAAERFLAATARVLDRRRFERLFRDGPATPVRDAVAAYEDADGGFGHALEPDARSPAGQPGAVALALRTLDEADAWDEALVARACDWLERVAPPEGGACFVDPAIEGWPHAPWWEPEPERTVSLVTTGPIAGTLLARGSAHPWLDRATTLAWERIDGLQEPSPYTLLGAVGFLEHAPDRPRAAAAIERLGDALRADPMLGPLTFAPQPDSIARAAFDAATIDGALDRLAAGQHEDGGWTFDWPAWSPVAAADWRGSVTVDALVVLRANDRWS
jgi:hypothetical protein